MLLASLLVSTVLAAPALAPFTESAVLESPTRHVRAADPALRTLLRRGYRESPSFAALITALQYSDLYVYIEEVPRLPHALDARLLMVPSGPDQRYVRVQIGVRVGAEEMIGLLGHELQHAVEVAGAAEVRSERDLATLYTRIGTRGGPHMFDTAAARDMGRVVRRELRS
jgi:hypothetical protein